MRHQLHAYDDILISCPLLTNQEPVLLKDKKKNWNCSRYMAFVLSSTLNSVCFILWVRKNGTIPGLLKKHKAKNNEESIHTCKNVHHHYPRRARALNPELAQMFLDNIPRIHPAQLLFKCVGKAVGVGPGKLGVLDFDPHWLATHTWEPICTE